MKTTRPPGESGGKSSPDRGHNKTPSQRGALGWVAKVALLLGSTLLALVISEIALRILGLAPGVKPIVVSDFSTVYTLSSNPVLGYELKASYRDENANLIVSYPRTNSHGQRDIERTVEKRPGLRRVILLGDSVVEGEGIREIDRTI